MSIDKGRCSGCGRDNVDLWKIHQGNTGYYRKACFSCSLTPEILNKIPAIFVGRGWDDDHYADWEEHIELHS